MADILPGVTQPTPWSSAPGTNAGPLTPSPPAGSGRLAPNPSPPAGAGRSGPGGSGGQAALPPGNPQTPPPPARPGTWVQSPITPHDPRTPPPPGGDLGSRSWPTRPPPGPPAPPPGPLPFAGQPAEAGPATRRLANQVEEREGFELQGILGRGAMGIVYRAKERATGRLVALKLILDNGMTPTRRARFAREGEITAALSHPNIVKVLAAGEQDGKPYLAYELVEGARTLGDVFLQLDLRRRVERLRDVARALGHAHQKGVIHRDVKPENVLVDRQDVVKVTDFGLAADEEHDRLTRSGQLLGTPTHMSPEAFRGKRADLGPPSDVFSLGVMLYRGLTGRNPFEGGTLADLGARIAVEDPRPPAELNRAVPPDLEAVCLKALEKDAKDRYADGEAMAKDLDLWLAGRPVVARKPSALARLFKGRALYVVPAVVVALLLTSAAIVLSGTRPTRGAPPPAQPR